MRIKMIKAMKNKNMQSNKVWSFAVQLMLLSFVLLLSQLTLAKDRIQYHVQNFDGSTLKVINEQGVVSQSYQYAPFGQQLQYKKPSNLKNPNAFVGGVQDADDLVYLKQRHYNPVLGRFYQPDPVTFIMKGHGQTNRYQYGWNDTYTFSDPSGLNPARVLIPLTAAEMQSYSLALSIDAKNLGAMINGLQGIHNLSNGLMLAGGIAVGTKTKEGMYAIGDVTDKNLQKAWQNLEKLSDKANNESNNNSYIVYKLVAEREGLYPDVRGTGTIHLNKGEVWKYGITSQANRYLDRDLRALGLIQRTISTSSYYRARASELSLIYGYTIQNLRLPPGNKIFR